MRSESEMTREAKQATPREQLLKELMDSREPKTEREHAAAREIIKLRAAAGQALEALEEYEKSYQAVADGLKPLRAALAEDAMQRLTDVQQEMESTSQESRQVEPVATINKTETVEPMAWLIEAYDIYAKRTLRRFVFDKPENMHGAKITAYYTAPPKRKPLTDEETLAALGLDGYDSMAIETARAIERAHGIGGEE